MQNRSKNRSLRRKKNISVKIVIVYQNKSKSHKNKLMLK